MLCHILSDQCHVIYYTSTRHAQHNTAQQNTAQHLLTLHRFTSFTYPDSGGRKSKEEVESHFSPIFFLLFVSLCAGAGGRAPGQARAGDGRGGAAVHGRQTPGVLDISASLHLVQVSVA